MNAGMSALGRLREELATPDGVPPTWLVMVAALVGVAIGPAILGLGSAGELRDLARTSGPFGLWVALIAAQTLLWSLATPLLVVIARRHWTSRPALESDEKRDAVAAVVVLALLVVTMPVVTHFVGSPPAFLPHGDGKVRLLTALALAVALVAALAITVIRARFERLRRAEPTKANLRAYLDLRRDLDRLLGYLGAVVGLAVLSSAAMWKVVEEQRHGDTGPFHAQSVVVYGIALSLFVALVYLPTFLAGHAAGVALRDRLAPFPEPGELADGLERRRRIDDALGLSVSATVSFRAGVAILAPLLGSLTSLLPEFGG